MVLQRLRHATIGLGLGLAALAVAGLLYDWLTDGRLGLIATPPAPLGTAPVAVVVAGENLWIPANLIRFSAERRAGAHDRLDLALLLPDLTGQTAETAPEFLRPARDGRLVFITIAPAGEALDTAQMLATIYQRYLDPATAPGPAGLIRQTFKPDTSYAGDELVFEPGSVHPFAARCFAESSGQPPVTCMRDVRLSGKLMATIRLPYRQLDTWSDLTERLDAILSDFRQPH